MKVFIGLREISGHYRSVARGLAALGHDVVFVGGALHPFDYGGDGQFDRDSMPLIPRLYEESLLKIRFTDKKHQLKRFYSKSKSILLQYLLFMWSIFSIDVFIFGYGFTFFEGAHDLVILKAFGKRVIVNIGHGSDARPPYIDGSRRRLDGTWGSLDRLRRQTKFLYRRTQRIERNADIVIGAPLTSQFLEKRVVSFFKIGNPGIAVPDGPAIPKLADGKLRLLHAPSRPIAKGSIAIRQIIKKLQLEFQGLELIEVTGQPNSVVLERIGHTNLVVDQLYSDSPFTGIAAEAAQLGKPVLIGGYALGELGDSDRDYGPAIRCFPEQLEVTLRYWLSSPTELAAMGRMAEDFMMAKWSPEAVAKRYEMLLLGQAPDDWFFDPSDYAYIEGVAIEREALRAHLKTYLAQFGRQGLYLSHRPDLEDKIIAFAAGANPSDLNRLPPSAA